MITLNCDTTRIKGGLLFDHPLARLNTWRVGGTAECFFEPADEEDLSFFLARCAGGHPVMCLGLGSNTLVRDGGVRGVVVSLRKGFKEIARLQQDVVRAGAGASCGQLARYCANRDLAGLAFMAGIPGTVGGALKMNAGAFGGATWDRVVAVETIDAGGTVRRQAAGEFEAGYRSVAMPPGVWFIAAEFQASRSEVAGSERKRVDELLRRRNLSQPVGDLNCGSVFKNPHGRYAAELIEGCGLKRCAVGGAEVSARHANFIVNRGGASAREIETLIRHVADTVRNETGVSLEPEVVIVGEMQ